MSTELWQRSYRVTIGKPTYTKTAYLYNGTITKGTPISTDISDEITIPSNARYLSNLESEGQALRGFSFELDSIRQLSEPDSGDRGEKTTLRLYNLDEDMINVINQEPCVVRVEAGYGGQISLAYAGDVMSVTPHRSGTDVVYTITCKDGGIAEKNTRINANYAETVPESDIILDMAQRFPATGIGNVGLEHLTDRVTTGGHTFVGSLVTNFDKVMAKNNLQYARFNGKMVIVPYRLEVGSANYQKFYKTNYTFSQDNVVDIVAVTERSNTLTSDEKLKSQPIQLNTFFCPVEVGQFFTVTSATSSEFAGTYQVTRVRTQLQSQGNAWNVTLTGTPI